MSTQSTKCKTLLIGGQIAAGKSSVARYTAIAGNAELLRARDALHAILGVSEDRRRLQAEGASLDSRSGGRWLVEYIAEHFAAGQRLVVDSARTRKQVEPILNERSDTLLVFLSATEATRRVRFASSALEDPVKRSLSYDEAMHHPTEVEARTIAEMSDLTIDTDDLGIEEVCLVILELCGWPVVDVDVESTGETQ